MIVRHTDQQVKDYYERAAINQSSLKIILSQGIHQFLDDQQQLLGQEDDPIEKEHFIIGSGVDSWITMGEDHFRNNYYCSQLQKKPGDKSMLVIKSAFARVLSDHRPDDIGAFDLYTQEISDACTEFDYRTNVGLDSKINFLLKENAREYWDDLILATGKQILSEAQAGTISTIISSFTNHPHTRNLFKDSEFTDIIYQLPCYFGNNNIPCKAMIDMIIINHKAKRILPVDLKTTRQYIINFNSDFKFRRYDIQGSFYKYAITKHTSSISTLLSKDVISYSIANMAFAVESTKKPGCPMIFPITDEVDHIGRWGDGKRYLGWEQALEKYNSWNSVDFSTENMFQDTNGVLFIGNDYEYQTNHVI